MSRYSSVSLLLTLLIALLTASCAGGPEPRPEPTEPSSLPAEVSPTEPGSAMAIAPITPELEARVDRYLAEMSLEELLGQRFMAFVPRELEVSSSEAAPPGGRGSSVAGGVAGDEVVDPVRELFEPVPPAGFILYRWNMPGYKGTALLTKELQRQRELAGGLGPRLIFGVDQEGGRVANLRFPEMAELPSQFQQGARRDIRYVESAAYIGSTDLRRAGIRMNFTPVLDLYPREDRTIIGDRAFGGEPELVSELGVASIEAAMEAGVVPVAKHFPGHGVTTVDSHGTLPVSDRSLDSLRRRELLPFRRAIEAGVPAIMTAHILYEEIDPEYPATLSPRFIQGILREELGFDGVVITDGFSMGALTEGYSRVEALRQSFLAGVDLVLLHARYEYESVFREVLELLEEGVISEAMIRQGARRVLLLKARAGLLP